MRWGVLLLLSAVVVTATNLTGPARASGEADPDPNAPTHAIRLITGEILKGRVVRTETDRTVFKTGGHERHFLKTHTEWTVTTTVRAEYEALLATATKQKDLAVRANVFATLGDQCRKWGMEPEAVLAYHAAIEARTDHAGARTALKFEREGEEGEDARWVSEGERMHRANKVRFDGKWVPVTELTKLQAAKAKADRARVVWIDWTWSFADDLDAHDHYVYEKVIRQWAERLWVVGEGNFALRSVHVIDKRTAEADMHTPKGCKNRWMLTDTLWARVKRGKVMEIPGRCDAYTWLHELGHRLFGTPEEYDTKPGCGCVESTGANGGEWRWCDELNHIDAQREQHLPCWEGYILRAYPDARHPGPGGELPKVKITFEDR
ncbi:MAG: hypothetical protein ACYTG4_09900 [Planctomycetota bacterium]|jgi:hypothetical protein